MLCHCREYCAETQTRTQCPPKSRPNQFCPGLTKECTHVRKLKNRSRSKVKQPRIMLLAGEVRDNSFNSTRLYNLQKTYSSNCVLPKGSKRWFLGKVSKAKRWQSVRTRGSRSRRRTITEQYQSRILPGLRASIIRQFLALCGVGPW